jgi:hypothetical protein
MSEKHESFIELCLQGRRLLDEIDDFVEAWHTNQGEEPLHEYLGMEISEYSLWMLDPEALAYIIKARHDQVPLADVINDDYEERRIAARAGDIQKVRRLRNWLEEQGKFD